MSCNQNELKQPHFTDATDELALTSHIDDMVIALLKGSSHAVTPRDESR